MKKTFAALSFGLLFVTAAFSQQFTLADTLRGSNGPGRSWWNATHYDLHVTLHPADSSIHGMNQISFSIAEKKHPGFFQIDLQQPMQIDSVLLEPAGEENRLGQARKLEVEKNGNAWFVFLSPKDHQEFTIQKAVWPRETPSGKTPLPAKKADGVLTVYFHGKPRVAVNPPWDGGIIWKKDSAGNPWVSVACQGLGASVWYPNKDWQGDEPDSAQLHITAPDNLVSVSNGRLRNTRKNTNGTSTYSWAVVNPINNYNLVPYTGKYVHFGEVYAGEKGDLTMDYWVLDSNLEKARQQFKDATRMMKAFEYWFGPYPFYEDGYKLVDAPHLGMEHQSAIAYGNGYENGYRGRDLSGSGHGLKFDFIIVHESGHEWFGNNITTKDIADMWVHEGFTNYSEALFVEFYYGKQAASEYVIGMRRNIRNDKPVQGVHGIQDQGSGDMYYKGSNMIHTMRQVIDNDGVFRNLLRDMNRDFCHQTVTGAQIEEYIHQKTGMDFTKVFDQYLRTVKVPVLEFKKQGAGLQYRWNNCVEGFNMPVRVYDAKGEWMWLQPATEYQDAPAGLREIKPDPNFYITVKEVV